MRRAFVAFGLACLLALAGCGSDKTAPAPSQDELGAQTKQMVDEFVQKARSRPRDAAAELTVLIESLDAKAEDLGGKFVELRDAAKELEALYARSASQDEVNQQLDKLAEKASALTG